MKRLLILLPFILASFSVQAQSDPSAERIDRLERDIMLLQRQLARSGVPVATSSGAGDLAPSADLEVRLSAIEESMRDLRGKAEENDFQVRKLNETLEKFQRDTEFRFSELNPASASSAAAAGATPATPAASPAASEGLKPRAPVATTQETPAASTAPDGPTTAGDGVLRIPAQNGETETFSTPRDLYNYAFRLLNQTRYEEAADAFGTFTKQYPKDPLIGNAYYWQGETFYIRRDYVNAADAFRQGFETLPSGPKAPDNLLKLAMSLDALDRDKEACVVLGQITTKFKKTSISIVDKAAQEQKRIGCAKIG